MKSKKIKKKKQIADFSLEQSLMLQGYAYIGGVDEAGRGPWAGPVSAGCVVITSPDQMIEGVGDSKGLTAVKRESLIDQIKDTSTAWGLGMVSAKEIDQIGIQEAVLKAMTIAVNQCEETIGKKLDYIIADGLGIRLIDGYKMDKITKGDVKHYSIAAGSIIAKVERDRLMMEFAKQYPQYGFESHVGYGTKKHIEALQKFGPCEIHRKTYKPIAKLLGLNGSK